MMHRLWLISGMTWLLASSLALGQSQIPGSSQPGTPPYPTAYPASAEPREPQTPHFQLTVNYGMGSLTLETNGSRSLTRPPNAQAYEDGQAVRGTYAGGGVKQLRTIASMIVPVRERTYIFGLGLEHLDIGVGGPPMAKLGGTEGSLHLSSLLIEIGALRSFNRWGQALVSASYDHALDGKLRSRYLTQSARSGTAGSYAIIEDRVQSGARLSISGHYQFHLLPGFALGLFTAAQYGTIRFELRDEASYIYGYTLGLSMLLRI